MKKLVVGLAVMLGFCMCAHQPSGTLDVNKGIGLLCRADTTYACGAENRFRNRLYDDAA